MEASNDTSDPERTAGENAHTSAFYAEEVDISEKGTDLSILVENVARLTTSRDANALDLVYWTTSCAQTIRIPLLLREFHLTGLRLMLRISSDYTVL